MIRKPMPVNAFARERFPNQVEFLKVFRLSRLFKCQEVDPACQVGVNNAKIYAVRVPLRAVRMPEDLSQVWQYLRLHKGLAHSKVTNVQG